MNRLLQDVRFAARMLRRAPLFSAVAVLALAIGIGANTAVFSAIVAVLLRPLPYPESDRLVKIWEKRPTLAKGRVSPADFVDWKSQARSFEQLAAYRLNDYNLLNVDEPEPLQGVAVSAILFSVLRVHPAIGREFTPSEETPGKDKVAILSRSLWLRRFAGDPAVIGKTINLDGNSISIIGVMPAGFSFPGSEIELWRPLAINPNSPMAGRNMHLLEVVGRLRAGTGLAQAAAEMHGIAGRLAAEYPRDNTGHDANVLRLQDDLTGAFRPSLLLLFAAVALVLLIACADVANLLLVRGSARRKEIAIRLALGATRSRIVRQLLTESVLLSILGGVLGIVFARIGIRLLLVLSPSHVPRLAESHVGAPVLLFTLAMAVATGVLFGLAPALHVSQGELQCGLAEGGRGDSTNRTTHRMRNAFVVVEVTLAAMLLIGAGLFLESFARVHGVNPGFRTDHVLVGDVSLPGSRYRVDQRAAFVQQVLDQLGANPDVRVSAGVTHLPLAKNGPVFDFAIEGRPPAPLGEDYKAQLRSVTPAYFQAIGTPLLAGRNLRPQDAADAPAVVVINDVMASRYWPRESPLGKRISFDKGDDGAPIWREVVGVVQGVRATGLEFEPEPQMYAPFAQFSMPFATFVIQSSAPPQGLSGELRRAVFDVDRNEPVSNIRTMDQVIAESTSTRRASATLLGLFAAIALVLAAMGIYGVLAYAVTQRTREIGIRVALGAQPARVLKFVVGEGMRLVAAGVGFGVLSSLALGRAVTLMLFGVNPWDPAVLAAAAVLLLGIAFLACFVPARRAIKISPAIALRHE